MKNSLYVIDAVGASVQLGGEEARAVEVQKNWVWSEFGRLWLMPAAFGR
jgi:hypothetical protein